MNLLTLSNVSKQYSERLLLDQVDLLINEGERIGLIGINGSGKSTLLRIAAGIESPDQGHVTCWGGVKVEFLPQEPILNDSLTVLEQIFHSDSPQMQLLRAYEEVSSKLQQSPDDPTHNERLLALNAEMDRTEGWVAEANAKTVLTRLGITRFDALIGTLSGGQRKRVALARALIDRADLLILDEPTNHIDAETVTWLEEYLSSTPGALFMVTHDRYFLDRVVNRIVELDRRVLVSYVGTYSQYLEARAQRHQQLAGIEEKQKRLLKRELAWLRRGVMARGTKQKARKQRAMELMEIRHDQGEDRVSIALSSRRLGTKVLTATGLNKAYDELRVVDQIDFHLEPGDRIGIVGPNGAGKSTFLDILIGKTAPDSGTLDWGDTVQLGYYDQQSLALDDQMRLIEFIENEAPVISTKDGERVDAAQMLEWFLFSRPMQWGRIGSLSGGERRRLYLLRTLIHQPNVLFLDEPTNDLDIQTLAVLEEFLDHFNGCLIVVSHDRYFLDRTVDHIISFEEGKIGPRYPTPYTTFQRLSQEAKEQENATIQLTPERGKEKGERQKSAVHVQKLSWKEQRELEKIEAQIQQLEADKEQLLTQMAENGGDYMKLQTFSGKLENLEGILEQAMERWMELEEMSM